jgi:HNH endonuclease
MCAQKRRGICAYCGRKRNLTDDHVPPRSWLGQPSPPNLITVPACYECNRGFQKNDDYTRTVVALDLRAQQNAAAVSHLPDIFHSLVRPEAAGFRARILQQMSSTQVLDHMGRPLGSRVSVERKRIDATGERLMRGLHFFEGRQPLSTDSKVYVFSKPGYHDIDFVVPAFTKVFDQCAAQRVREVGPGFSYVAGANGDVFVWLMLLYGYFWWVVAVVPSHVQLPIADLQPPPQQ